MNDFLPPPVFRPWLWHLGLLVLLGWLLWHIFGGERGLLMWWQARADLIQDTQRWQALVEKNTALREKIQGLKEPIDVDLLEERARAVLGYMRPRERVILLDPPDNAK